jgi:oxalate---CoA ligase
MIIRDLLSRRPADTIALSAPGRPTLTYGALLSQSDEISGALAARGIGAGHKLAIVLPNGPEMATAFLASANVCTTAPLNPTYREDEFAFYLDDLKARALLVKNGSASPAIAAALKLGVEIIELSVPETAPSGYFLLRGSTARLASQETNPLRSCCTLQAPPRGRKSSP